MLGEPLRVFFLMAAVVVRHAGLGEAAARGLPGMDRLPGVFVPAHAEAAELGEELHLRIRNMVVDPPGQRPPVSPLVLLVVGQEARHDDAGARTFLAVLVGLVPDVAGVVPLVSGAVVL